MKYLTHKDVISIHDQVILSHELQGVAHHKSVESVIARIENRIHYGMISDVFELAACYATYIGVAHCFNDANKRTAFMSMDVVLRLNDIHLVYDTTAIGDIMIEVAQGNIDEDQLTHFLRNLAEEQKK